MSEQKKKLSIIVVVVAAVIITGTIVIPRIFGGKAGGGANKGELKQANVSGANNVVVYEAETDKGVVALIINEGNQDVSIEGTITYYASKSKEIGSFNATNSNIPAGSTNVVEFSTPMNKDKPLKYEMFSTTYEAFPIETGSTEAAIKTHIETSCTIEGGKANVEISKTSNMAIATMLVTCVFKQGENIVGYTSAMYGDFDGVKKVSYGLPVDSKGKTIECDGCDVYIEQAQ